ncbi:hypothetical protein F4821DRAFT_127021 [Hypoxylon rubiginosum]|uniref:Uncharacterized protein n=1 Tax=Hypoxylon rubiginosum TaxID=110542 RepID=A0ACC0D1P9_9PEZI|nr:hypothetical protein F4821DRAFT_127021 [Hypoxylon rubiginosum]
MSWSYNTQHTQPYFFFFLPTSFLIIVVRSIPLGITAKQKRKEEKKRRKKGKHCLVSYNIRIPNPTDRPGLAC